MFTFIGFDTDWYPIFAALLVAVVVGRLSRNESRLYMLCLIAAVLTQSWIGVIVAVLISLVGAAFDIVWRLWN